MSTLANKPVADAVDVACTDDELIVTLVDGRRVSAPRGAEKSRKPILLHASQQAGQLHVQLRDRRRALGIVAAAEPSPRRLQRDGSVPPIKENRYRRGRDLRAGSIRFAGELFEFQ